MNTEAEVTPETDVLLPQLREDLHIQEGIRDVDGHRTWTLFDPVRNRYFQLTEHDFNLISCWHLRTAKSVMTAMAERHLPLDREYIEDFVRFLVGGELVIAQDNVRERLARLSTAREQGLWQALLHLYLSFRIPLFHPDRFLNWLYPRIRFLFSYGFLRLSLLTGILGAVLIARQWDTFIRSFSWFFNPTNMVVFFVCLAVVKIIHEFGHALMSRHFGLRVPTMGVAFLVMWPVLYTDASDAWRLQSRRQRALISFAGVLTETVLVCYAMLAWVFVPDGIVRSMLFSIITTVWVTSIAVNLNPVMRFDGYYFFSDILNVPNLQDRSFALAKWKLRQWLFDVGLQPPEPMRSSMRRIMIGYAFYVWIYRFFLFLGIALLVYHFFFKALGIFLFGVEMWWFIMRPILSETRSWGGFWKVMTDRRKGHFQYLAAAVVLVVVFPWRADLHLPAQVADADTTRLFPARDAEVDAVLVADGQQVMPGQLLVRMHSPELDYQLRLARLELQTLESAAGRYASAGHADQRLVLEQDLDRARSQLVALEDEHERLQIRAPFAGTVRDLEPTLRDGRWVSHDSRLLTLVGGHRAKVTAWVGEEDLGALPEAAFGHFYPDRRGLGVMNVKLVSVERAPVSALDSPYQASAYGGNLPVRPDRNGKLIPEVALYRVELAVTRDTVPTQVSRGWVSIEGRRRTLIGRFARLVAGTLIRESGF